METIHLETLFIEEGKVLVSWRTLQKVSSHLIASYIKKSLTSMIF